MDLIDVKETSSAATPEVDVQSEPAGTDRRRPGRTEVSQSLLPLLRASAEQFAPHMATMDTDTQPASSDGSDALAPARGLAFGLLLSVPLWAIIAAIVAAIIR